MLWNPSMMLKESVDSENLRLDMDMLLEEKSLPLAQMGLLLWCETVAIRCFLCPLAL